MRGEHSKRACGTLHAEDQECDYSTVIDSHIRSHTFTSHTNLALVLSRFSHFSFPNLPQINPFSPHVRYARRCASRAGVCAASLARDRTCVCYPPGEKGGRRNRKHLQLFKNYLRTYRTMACDKLTFTAWRHERYAPVSS